MKGTEFAHFPYSSICLNRNFEGRTHRDMNNFGPSVIIAVGEYQDGQFMYWESDNRMLKIEDLEANQMAKPCFVDIKERPFLYDGRRMHTSESAKGERWSLIFYTHKWYDKIPKGTREFRIDQGTPWPVF